MNKIIKILIFVIIIGLIILTTLYYYYGVCMFDIGIERQMCLMEQAYENIELW